MVPAHPAFRTHGMPGGQVYTRAFRSMIETQRVARGVH